MFILLYQYIIYSINIPGGNLMSPTTYNFESYVQNNDNDTITATSTNQIIVLNGSGVFNASYPTTVGSMRQDIVSGVSNINVTSAGNSFSPSSMTPYKNGDDLVISLSAKDSMTIAGFFSSSSPVNVNFYSGSTLSASTLIGSAVVSYSDGAFSSVYTPKTGSILTDTISPSAYTTSPNYVAYISPFHNDSHTALTLAQSYQPTGSAASGYTYSYELGSAGSILDEREYNAKGQLAARYYFDVTNNIYTGAYDEETYSYNGNGSLATDAKYEYDDTGKLFFYQASTETPLSVPITTGWDGPSTVTFGNVTNSYQNNGSSVTNISLSTNNSSTTVTATDLTSGNTLATMNLSYSVVNSNADINTALENALNNPENYSLSSINNAIIGNADYAGDLIVSGTISGTSIVGLLLVFNTSGKCVYDYRYTVPEIYANTYDNNGNLLTQNEYTYGNATSELRAYTNNYVDGKLTSIITNYYDNYDPSSPTVTDKSQYVWNNIIGTMNGSIYSINDTSATGNNILTGLVGPKNYITGSINDVINDTLSITNDTLVGGADDIIYASNSFTASITGGAGDTIYGNGLSSITGNGYVYYENTSNINSNGTASGTGDTITDKANNGTIISSVNYSLGVNTSGINKLVLTGTDSLIGIGSTSSNLTITSNGYGDSLVGGGGTNDTFVVGATNTSGLTITNNVPTVTYNMTGADTINASSSPGGAIDSAYNYSINASNVSGIQNLTLTAANIYGEGNIGNNTIISSFSNDTLIGGGGNDIINGQSGAYDYLLDNGTGNTTLEVSGGHDTLVSGSGIDTLVGGTGSNNVYYINNAGDSISGTGTGNTVYSSVSLTIPTSVTAMYLTSNTTGFLAGYDNNSTNDTLVGMSGTEDYILIGGKGADSIVGYGGQDILYAGSASLATTLDTLVGANGNDTLVGNSHSTLVGGAGNDTYIIGAANITATGTTTTATNATDVIFGDTIGGTDTVDSAYNYSLAGSNIHNSISAPSVNDLILTGNSAIYGVGNSNDNLIIANSGNDTLVGGISNSLGDTLVAGSGNDSLVGLSGINDSIVGGSGNDTFVGSGSDLLYGGTGNNTFNTASNTNGFSYNAVTNSVSSISVASDTITDGSGTNIIISTGNYSLANNSGITNLTVQGSAVGNSNNNLITDNDTLTADILYGGGGNDTIIGNNKADTIVGNSSGIDSIVGGSGANQFYEFNTNVGGKTLNSSTGQVTVTYVSSGSDIISETGNLGTINSAVNYSLNKNVSGVTNLTLIGTNALIGEGSNTTAGSITGNNAGDTLVAGTAGKESLTGGTGADYIDGSRGTVNYLNGGNGNDTLVGNGTDYLNDGTGNNTFITKANVTGFSINSTTYSVTSTSATSDTITDSSGTGINTIISTGSYSIANNLGVANLTVQGSAAGNSINNLITDNGTGADILYGGGGNDTIIGNNNADTIIGYTGNVDSIVGGSGANKFYEFNANVAGDTLNGSIGQVTVGYSSSPTDTISETGNSGTIYSGVNYSLSDNVSGVPNLTLTGSSKLIGEGSNATAGGSITGNNAGDTLVSGIAGKESLTGGTGADYIDGSRGTANYLTGGGGNDTLVGNGTDYLNDGTGNNTFITKANAAGFAYNAATNVLTSASVVSDTITDTSGINTIISSGSYSIANNLGIKNLIVQGSAVGNSNNNLITDTINGAGTADILYGGGGNDTIIGNNNADTIIGNTSGVDSIVGGSGANVFYEFNTNVSGKTLNISTGQVSVAYASSATDTISETGNSGTIYSRVNYSLNKNVTGVSNLTLTGTAALLGEGSNSAIGGNITGNNAGDTLVAGYGGSETLTGGTGNDYIDGSRGSANYLIGGSGNDTLIGSSLPGGFSTLVGGKNGLGNTDYIVSNTSDTIIDQGAGNSTIFSSVNYDLTAVNVSGVRNLTLTGNATAGTGDITSGVIQGNNLNDSLTANGVHVSIIAGSGNNTINVNGIYDSIIAGNGNDTINVNAYCDTITAGNGNNYIKISMRPFPPGDYVSFGSGNDTVIGDDFATLVGGTGSNTYIENANILDTSGVITNLFSDDIIDPTGTNTVIASGSYSIANISCVTNLQLTSSGDIAIANSGNDTIWANGGAGDTLVAGTGKDSLIGSIGGNTTFEFNSGDGIDTITGAHSDGSVIQFGSGVSTSNIYFSTNASGNLCIDYGSTAGMSEIILQGSGYNANTNVNAVICAEAPTYDGISEIEMSNGTCMNASDINRIINSINQYAVATGTNLSSITADKSNSILTTIVNSGWHS